MRGLHSWIFSRGDATSGELSIRGCLAIATDLRTLREAVSVDVAEIAISLPAGLPVVTADEQVIASVLIVRCAATADWDDNLDTDGPFSCPFAAIKKTQS